jgi:hypothetical protein
VVVDGLHTDTKQFRHLFLRQPEALALKQHFHAVLQGRLIPREGTMVWPWQEFNWGVFWALIAAFLIADLVKSAIQLVIGKLSE